ncbi:MAG: Cys-tRNA(Pro) deacylase [Candidatus Bipolaricaulota bacterium]|nr:MAG: Cys-tRNA(Pro) deacylase [Candidatus Bipolaricaulota bacterium]
MTTRGIEQIKAAGIAFRRLDYEPLKDGVRYAAGVLDIPFHAVVKSLVFAADDGQFLFALMTGDGNVSTKKLARAIGRKRVQPASPHDAERVTGYRVGGISPLGSRRALPTVLDAHAADEPWLVINAGDRGVLVRLETADLIALIAPQIADIRVE